MTISPISGFPVRPRPYSNITPFTYRDGLSYLRVLEDLRGWLHDTLVPHVNGEVSALVESWITTTNELGESVALAIGTRDDDVIQQIQNLVSEANTLVDGIIANQNAYVDGKVVDMETLVSNTVSTIDNLVSTTVSGVNETVDDLRDEVTDAVATIEANGPEANDNTVKVLVDTATTKTATRIVLERDFQQKTNLNGDIATAIDTSEAVREALETKITESTTTWLLVHGGPPASQSNIAGRGTPYSTTSDPANNLIYQMGSKTRTLRLASEPLDMNETLASTTGIGPLFQFARQLISRGLNSGRRILLIPGATGGSQLVKATTPTWRSSVANSLWANWVQQRADAIAAIESRGEKWVDFAALSIHGEADGDNFVNSTQYRNDYDANIDAMRAIVGGDMPLIIGQMVSEYTGTGTRAAINFVHYDAPNRKVNTAFVTAPIGAQYNLNDGNHFNRAGQVEMASRMCDAFAKVTAGLPYPTTVLSINAIADAFERANSTTSLGKADTGQTWTSYNGQWGIADAQAYCSVAATANEQNFAGFDSGMQDASCTVRFTLLDNVSHQRLIFRATDAMNYWCVMRRADTGKYRLYKLVAGVFTQIGSDSTMGSANADHVRANFVGSSITIKINDVVAFNVTDSYNNTATKHGIGVGPSSTGHRFDGFYVTTPQ